MPHKKRSKHRISLDIDFNDVTLDELTEADRDFFLRTMNQIMAKVAADMSRKASVILFHLRHPEVFEKTRSVNPKGLERSAEE